VLRSVPLVRASDLPRWRRSQHSIAHVEVALSGLGVARGRKAFAYARGGIADYWIVSLIDRVVEIHREPARRGPARRRWGYAAIETFSAEAMVTPLAAPGGRLLVADLLP